MSICLFGDPPQDSSKKIPPLGTAWVSSSSAPGASPADPSPDPEDAYRRSTNQISPGIRFGEDGKLRWCYEVDLLKDWGILGFVLKSTLLLLSLLLLSAVLLLFFAGSPVQTLLMFFAIFSGAILFCGALICGALICVVYFLSAKFYWRKSACIFEMDQEGVSYFQMRKDFDKLKSQGMVLFFAGMATGSYFAAAGGLGAMVRQKRHASFQKVRRIIPKPSLDQIQLISFFLPVFVYAPPEEYAFVLEFLQQRCPKAK